ncbi:MAG: amidohydrolase [Clostridiales bacterium]|nr:amidohydrolase [Clostridiales bacterium]
MIIDFHTHCFPDKIALSTVNKLSFSAGGLKFNYDGSLTGLKESMKSGGVDISVVLNIATNPLKQNKVNDFASSINNEQDIFAFGSVHPDSEDVFYELERIKELGLKGVKLHPEYQNFYVDDKKMFPIYKKISDLNLITVFHAGYDYGFPPPYKATTERIVNILNEFSSPVVLAHFGGIDCYEKTLELLCGKNVYLDISCGYGMMPKFFAKAIIEKHGFDKILFGTDSPWYTAETVNKLLSTLKFSEENLNKIKFENAKKLLNIK